MRVPSLHTTIVPARRLAVGTLVLGLAVAACGSSATPTTAPSAEAPAATASAAAATTPVSATTTPVPAATPSPSPTLEAMTLLWQQGGPAPTTKSSTWSPVVNPKTGDVWVADSYENRFWIFRADGTYLESWGGAGKGDGQFDFRDHAVNADAFGGIAFAPDGSFYVADTGNHRVQAFSASRKFVRSWGTFGSDDSQFVSPLSVVTDGKTVYVGDGDRSDIQAFDTTGMYLRTFGGDGGYSVFLALDAKGNLYATNPSTHHPAAVGVFDPTGVQVATIDMAFAGGDPVGVAVSANGDLFVSVDGLDAAYTPMATYEFDASGHQLDAWSTAGQSLALSANGDALCMAYSDNQGNGWAYIRAYALPKP